MTEILKPTPEQEAQLMFQNFLDKAAEWKQKAESIEVNSINDKAAMKEAKELRLALRQIRLDAGETKKELKADALKYTRAVDACYNQILEATKPVEAILEDKEKFAEREEAKRILELTQKRQQELAPYFLEDEEYPDLSKLDDTTFDLLLQGAKAKHAQRQEDRKKEAEEAQRLEAEREAERVRLENENAELQAKIAEERAKAEEARKAEQAKMQEEIEKNRAEAQKRQDEMVKQQAREQARLGELQSLYPLLAYQDGVPQPLSPAQLVELADAWIEKIQTIKETIKA